MEVVYQRCAGIDVHQRFLVVCLSMVEGEQRRKEIRSFRNETADLLALRAWLLQEQCSAVGMERTGVYWMPVYRRLEGFFELIVANAQHMKAVPGRKTDVQDADWIADLLQHGLLTASFVPRKAAARSARPDSAAGQPDSGAISPGQSGAISVLDAAGCQLSAVESRYSGVLRKTHLAGAVCWRK